MAAKSVSIETAFRVAEARGWTTMGGSGVLGPWLERYKEAHSDLLKEDPSFARWLDEEYVPLVGGWHY